MDLNMVKNWAYPHPPFLFFQLNYLEKRNFWNLFHFFSKAFER